MAVLRSALDPASTAFAANAAPCAPWSTTCGPGPAPSSERGAGGDERSIARHRERGKLPVRERIERLIDPGSAFLELSALAANGLYDGEAPGAGIVTGIGLVEGVECVVVANDATVKGGTYFPMTVKKHLRAQEIALENRLPCLYLVDSGGAFLPLQDEVFPDREHFGRIFYNQAQLSAHGIPQIALVMGSSTAGGAYVPGDVRRDGHRQGHRHDLPRRPAAGEGGDRRGGQRRGAGRRRGAHRDQSAWPTTSPSTTSTPWRSGARSCATWPGASRSRRGSAASRRAPSVNPEELYGVIPADPRQLRRARGDRPARRRQRVPRVQGALRRDAGLRLRPHRGLPGRDPGQQRDPVQQLVAEGRALRRAGQPAAHPARLPAEHHRLHGRQEYEAGGIAKDGAKLVTAVATTAVPKFTVIIGGSLRRRELRDGGPRLLARASCGCGPTPASASWAAPRRPASSPRCAATSTTDAERDAFEAPILAEYERQGSPYYSTARLWDDGVIDPLDTRRVLAMGISAALNAAIGETRSASSGCDAGGWTCLKPTAAVPAHYHASGGVCRA